jgi:tetratricopeptide (TPR) repeat protein
MTGDRIATFQQLLDANPDDAFARYGLAMEYRRLGNSQMALEEFERLRHRQPGYTAGYQMAAQLLLERGDLAAARERLRQGIACAQAENNARAEREMHGMLEEAEGYPE